MGHIWLVPTPCFERSHNIKLFMRHSILYIGCTVYSLIPKLWWQSLSLRHIGCHLFQWSVLSLSNTILLWCVRDWMLHMNTCIFTILNELRLDILTTIVRYEDLEFPPILVFNQSLKDFEEDKNFRLMLQEVNPTIPGKVIYEFQCIFGLTHWNMRKWTRNITVDQLKSAEVLSWLALSNLCSGYFPGIQPWQNPLENLIFGNPMIIYFSLRSERYL